MVAATKVQKANRNKTLKLPGMRALYKELLASYDLQRAEPDMRGSWADVYDLGAGKLLRIEFGVGSVHTVDNELWIAKQAAADVPNLVPRIFRSERVSAHESNNTGYLTATVVEKVKGVVPWTEWRKVYKTADQLITAMFVAVAKLYTAGYVHKDMSPANVLLTTRGIKFIDIADACPHLRVTERAMVNKFCDAYPPLLNQGFVAPEWMEFMEQGSAAKWGWDLRKVLKIPGASTRTLMRNMLYGAGAILVYALTGTSPTFDRRELEKLLSSIKPRRAQLRIRLAMHDNATRRMLTT